MTWYSTCTAPLGRAGAPDLGSGVGSVSSLWERKKYSAMQEQPLETERYDTSTCPTSFMVLAYITGTSG